MSKGKKQNFFWVSYSDLMTSLFFIMLLLFVLATGGMYLSKEATEEQLKKIEEIQAAVNQLPKEFFTEDTVNHRWSLRKEYSPKFESRDANIYTLNDTASLNEVGHSLLQVVANLEEIKQSEKYQDMDISFLVVIEGMSSYDNYSDNDQLSYRRALSLYYLWKKNGISFEDSQCEVQISGSGVRGIRPHNTDFYEAMKEAGDDAAAQKRAYLQHYNADEEHMNQCIIIQIIPKISNI